MCISLDLWHIVIYITSCYKECQGMNFIVVLCILVNVFSWNTLGISLITQHYLEAQFVGFVL